MLDFSYNCIFCQTSIKICPVNFVAWGWGNFSDCCVYFKTTFFWCSCHQFCAKVAILHVLYASVLCLMYYCGELLLLDTQLNDSSDGWRVEEIYIYHKVKELCSKDLCSKFCEINELPCQNICHIFVFYRIYHGFSALRVIPTCFERLIKGNCIDCNTLFDHRYF